MKEERLRQAFISGYVAAKVKTAPEMPLSDAISEAIEAEKKWEVLELSTQKEKN